MLHNQSAPPRAAAGSRTVRVKLLQPRRVGVEHQAAFEGSLAGRHAVAGMGVQLQAVGLCSGGGEGAAREGREGGSAGSVAIVGSLGCSQHSLNGMARPRSRGHRRRHDAAAAKERGTPKPTNLHQFKPINQMDGPVSVLSLSNTHPLKPAAARAPQSTQRMSATDRCGSASGWSLCGMWVGGAGRAIGAGTSQRAGQA